MNLAELTRARDFSIKVSIEAGKILLKHQKNLARLKISYKDAAGVASKADTDSEEYIIKEIHKLYKDHIILAEESAYKALGKSSKKNPYSEFQAKEYCWVIDPLDGTSNYLNGLDYFAICLGLVHKGEVIMGVVYRPVTGECFSAIREKGCYLENLKKGTRRQKIFADSNPKRLKNSLLVTGFASEKVSIFNQEFKKFKEMMAASRGVRRFGSAALDLCYVAQGIMDGFWERGLAPWDLCASSLICEEAGVKLSDYNGCRFQTFQSTIIAARPPLFKEITDVLNKKNSKRV